jgi:hypothetical protein
MNTGVSCCLNIGGLHPNRTQVPRGRAFGAHEPTQTTPTGDERKKRGRPGEGGLQIPIPECGDLMKDSEKSAPADDRDNGYGR